MPECPLRTMSGDVGYMLPAVCLEKCRPPIEKGSLAGVEIFEQDWDERKECIHKSLEFVSEQIRVIGDNALRQYGVTYECIDCNLQLQDPIGYKFKCSN